MSETTEHTATPTKVNGTQQQVQIDPQQVARAALLFLSRCDLKPHERNDFGVVEALLTELAQGKLTIASSAPPSETRQ